MQKLMKTSDELIQHMKNKGIKFNIINEVEAKEILENRNYYLKLASYRNNYIKDSGKYCNLEFAYLKKLSDIDMKLRYLIIQMTLDIEHFMKVELINDVEKNNIIAAYQIVNDFLNVYPKVLDGINNQMSSGYCGDLVSKYKDNCPIWVLVEIISFGDMIKLYNFYCKEYNSLNLKNAKLLYYVRNIRNASAHSNCLIHNLKKQEKSTYSVNNIIINYIKTLGFSRTTRKTKLNNNFFVDFTALLYIYKIFVKSSKLKEQRKRELNTLFNTTIIKNKDYFTQNQILKSSYNFCKKLVDNF